MNILHICAQLDGGGVERTILNYIKVIDKRHHCFYIIKHTEAVGMLEQELKELNIEIRYVIPKSKSMPGYLRGMLCCLREWKIDIVHCHQGYVSFLPLLLAMMLGIKQRIAHGHTAFEREGKVRKWYRRLCTALTRATATELLACSKTAGIWMWGKKFIVIPNVMERKVFFFSQDKRTEQRKKLVLGEEFVVGCVSRMAPGKNHRFLLEIFHSLLQYYNDACLILVGNGSQYQAIERKIKELGLQNQVKMIPGTNRVGELLNAFDAFVLPTQYEGLGICLVEAQLNGLPAYTTKGAVPEEAKITSNLTYMDSDSPRAWAEEILMGERHELTAQELKRTRVFESSYQAERLLQLYKGGRNE